VLTCSRSRFIIAACGDVPVSVRRRDSFFDEREVPVGEIVEAVHPLKDSSRDDDGARETLRFDLCMGRAVEDDVFETVASLNLVGLQLSMMRLDVVLRLKALRRLVIANNLFNDDGLKNCSFEELKLEFLDIRMNKVRNSQSSCALVTLLPVSTPCVVVRCAGRSSMRSRLPRL
jgi:hypothetical protein